MTTGDVIRLVAIDSAAWLVIHLGAAWAGTRLPHRWFHPEGALFRERGWEQGGRIYERGFRVTAWKHLLPDGAALFRGGFRKARLRTASRAYLERFRVETCRGELVHWVVLFCAPLFFLWNPWWVGCLMIAYAVAANLPCILVQRFNRIRLSRILKRKA